MPFVMSHFVLKLAAVIKNRFSLVYRQELIDDIEKYQELIDESTPINDDETLEVLEKRFDIVTDKFLTQEGLSNDVRLSQVELKEDDGCSNIYNT
jgi:hypothetical protein